MGNANDNTIIGDAGKDSLYGGEGHDSLYGGKGNDKLYEQDGDDTIGGGAGNDLLTGGDGEDLFIFSAGKDTISDYVAGEDQISLGADISGSSISGANGIVKIGSNVLTIKNVKHQVVDFIGANNEEFQIAFGIVTLDNFSASTYTAETGVDYIDATKRSTAITITGNELNNSIVGGNGKDKLYGLEGEDSLLGGKGNDTIWGGEGDDTIIGGLGNDSLWDNEGSNTFVFNAGDSKDLITGFGEENFDDNNTLTFKKYATDSFNINGTHYEVKGNVLKPIDG